MMDLRERVASYNTAFAKWPASHLSIGQEMGHDVLYGKWLIGAFWGNASTFPGAYPRGYMERMAALFPETTSGYLLRHLRILHAFSGSMPAGPYLRLDRRPQCGAELVGDLTDLSALMHAQARQRNGACLKLVLTFADPPYSANDARTLYKTKMPNRGRCMRALAEMTVSGGYVVWLDTVWPMHAKTEWRTVGRITLIRSTNHRVREISIFERV